MRRANLLAGAAFTCALGLVVFVLPHFLPRRNAASPPPPNLTKPAAELPTQPGAIAAAQRAVPWTLPPPSRAASAGGSGNAALQADAAHDRFARWTEKYLAASTAAEKAALLEQGQELASARREFMAALIEIDPKRALELAAPWKWHQELPAEIAALLEQRVSGRGSYSVFGAVPLEGQQEFVGPILRYVTLDSRSYRAFVYGRRLRQISQPQLTFHGVAINDALAVHEDPVRVLGADEAAALLA